MEFHFPPLFIVLTAAALAPLLGRYTSRIGLPVIVLEILLGMLIGPHGLGWGDPQAGAVPHLAEFGVAFLFFLAGLEIDLVSMRDGFKRILLSWGLVLLGSFACAWYLREQGVSNAMLILTLVVSTTALGILVPILRDRELLDTRLGQSVMALGAAGEVGPILVMSLAMSRHHSAPVQSLLTLAFIVVVLLVGWCMMQAKTPRVLKVLAKTLTQSSQMPIRISVLLLVGLAVFAEDLGLDIALGALASGMMIGLAMREHDSHVFHLKVDAIGFGFLVPIFFIVSGMKLDMSAMFDSAAPLAMMGMLLVALLVTRIPVVLIYWRELGCRQSLSLGLMSATTLSLIVVLVDAGASRGMLTPAEAAAMVAAGMVTVVLFPALAAVLAGKSAVGKRGDAEARDGL